MKLLQVNTARDCEELYLPFDNGVEIPVSYDPEIPTDMDICIMEPDLYERGGPDEPDPDWVDKLNRWGLECQVIAALGKALPEAYLCIYTDCGVTEYHLEGVGLDELKSLIGKEL